MLSFCNVAHLKFFYVVLITIWPFIIFIFFNDFIASTNRMLAPWKMGDSLFFPHGILFDPLKKKSSHVGIFDSIPIKITAGYQMWKYKLNLSTSILGPRWQMYFLPPSQFPPKLLGCRKGEVEGSEGNKCWSVGILKVVKYWDYVEWKS